MAPADPDDEIARVFTAVAADYDRSGVEFFRLFAGALVDTLEPQPGWHVLDVGAGRGAVVFALLDAAPVSVTAVDVAAGMVDLLRADVAAAGRTDVMVELADVAALPLADGCVDAVTAAMSLFFVPDVPGALREIRRVLRPDGMLAFTVFGPADPKWAGVYEAFRPYLPDDVGDLSRPRHPQLHDPPQILRTLDAAGFREAQCHREVHDIVFASVEQWHAWSWSVGLRGVWTSIPEPDRPPVRDAVLAAVDTTRRPDGRIVEQFAVDYVTCRR